jgi:hypothetical protein
VLETSKNKSIKRKSVEFLYSKFGILGFIVFQRNPEEFYDKMFLISGLLRIFLITSYLNAKCSIVVVHHDRIYQLLR